MTVCQCYTGAAGECWTQVITAYSNNVLEILLVVGSALVILALGFFLGTIERKK
jgi:hypothetical protein